MQPVAVVVVVVPVVARSQVQCSAVGDAPVVAARARAKGSGASACRQRKKKGDPKGQEAAARAGNGDGTAEIFDLPVRLQQVVGRMSHINPRFAPGAAETIRCECLSERLDAASGGTRLVGVGKWRWTNNARGAAKSAYPWCVLRAGRKGEVECDEALVLP